MNKKDFQNREFDEVEIIIVGTEEKRKPALSVFNRAVNYTNVELLSGKMIEKGYRKGEEIQVFKAEAVIKEGMPLLDINNNLIPLEKFSEYFAIVDGQHRTFAVSLYNDYREKHDLEKICVPAIESELKNGESITELINELNFTKKEWSKEDYLNGAANLLFDHPLLNRFNELIKTAQRPWGMPLSTINLIYTLSSGLSRNDLVKLCYGQIEKGVRKRKMIIPPHNIERGDRFIETCRKATFRDSEISKRYLIQKFIEIRNSQGEDFAFKVFESITQDDVKVMMPNGRLLEQNVEDYSKILIARTESLQANGIEKDD